MIGIIDYGLGNIKAFSNVYNRLNIPHFYISSREDLLKATKIILPGVGAFDHAMGMLNKSGLREDLDKAVLERKVPVLGICVGMQMMANSSEEGTMTGLNWIEGTVRKFSFSDPAIKTRNPLPHMGWNQIIVQKNSFLFDDLDEEKRFYFLHSYYFDCVNKEHSAASAKYGFEYSCVVNKENVYGIQCHPEKSHHNGVTFLKNFAAN